MTTVATRVAKDILGSRSEMRRRLNVILELRAEEMEKAIESLPLYTARGARLEGLVYQIQIQSNEFASGNDVD